MDTNYIRIELFFYIFASEAPCIPAYLQIDT